jgi:acetyl-CoA carboxylase biotin carboxyl carrier protein
VGDTVTPETIVCIVEAMKTFNELPAGVSGKIAAVLVKEEESVDVNKPLFKVIPS